MRIHTDVLNPTDLYSAALIARVDLDLDIHGSRSRALAFNVTLRGESNRKPNYGTSRTADRFSSEKAATWDQWGVFLGVLFNADPAMVTPYYADAEDFHRQTADRFRPRKQAGKALTFIGIDDLPGDVVWWPEDAHGDHHFTYKGTAFEQSCTKCSATKRWSR